MSWRRRFAYSRGFNGGSLGSVDGCSVKRRGARFVAVLAELLEHELHADAHVFLQLRERKACLLEILFVLGAERGAADLRKILRDLGDGSALALRALSRQTAEAETGQEAVAPRSEPAH